MTHSPEPWKTDFWLDGPMRVVDAEGEDVCGVIIEFGGFSSPIYSKPENMERIVACVNACEGIPTETLEHIAKHDWETCQQDNCNNPAEAPHTCPFGEEISGDESLCICCSDCATACRYDI